MSAPATARHPYEGSLSPGRPDSRARSHTLALIDISHRLRPRDLTIAALLEAHTTLCTDQLTALLFGSPITCRHRLHLLRRLGFLDRFLHTWPDAPGPVCWLPGPLGARYIALSRNDTPPTAKGLRERTDRIATSPTLRHLLAVNQFYVTLLAHARGDPAHPGDPGDPAADLTRWWSERDTAAAFGQRIHPDGHGVWTDRHGETGFFLELDRGTEQISRLTAKLAPHRRLRDAGGPDYPLLFVVPGPVREQNLHRRLAETPVGFTVATTWAGAGAGAGPAGPVWWIAGTEPDRVRLSELPSSHGPAGPLTPGPPTAIQHPLYLLTLP
ncbi:replication-relaxation family protein [Actinoplanes sp. NPDC051633]|uniref:replication-relaxation family protein n=1 Tax=Actinoplanes sp. NPDC051633 TaxID=3155670 RepID=UPI003447DE9A